MTKRGKLATKLSCQDTISMKSVPTCLLYTSGESKKRDNILAHRFGGYHSIFAMFRVMENQVVLGDIVPQNEAMRVLHLLLWEYQKKLRTDDLKYFYYTQMCIRDR